LVNPAVETALVTVRAVPPLENWSAPNGATALLLPQST